MRRFTFAVTTVGLLVGACSSPPDQSTTITSAADQATTTTTPTTTTTRPPGTEAISPLNGLPVDDETLLERRVLAIKVDNHPSARPPSGLQEADAVLELLVEGGFTRFVALFHSADSGYVGPIRSVRPTDPQLISALGGTIVMSGGQPWVQQIAAGHGVSVLTEASGGSFRIGSRSAPHNLYGDTTVLREIADTLGYPDEPPQAWFPIGDWHTPNDTAATILIHWSVSDVVEWTYEGGEYRRRFGGSPQEWVDADGERGQIAADVIVVIGSRFYLATPPPGVEATPLPAVDTIGEGPAWIFADGRAWEGTWRRAFPEDAFTLLNDDGTPALVPTGRPWISFLPLGQLVEWD
ncbi:MAG: DUF3048 domain-containing protein [Acidimicrobiia bacterium]